MNEKPLLYGVILFSIAFLGAMTYLVWRRGSPPSKQSILSVQKSAEHLVSLGNYEGALVEITPLIEQGVFEPAIEMLYIQILRGTGQYEEALDRIERLLLVESENLKLFQEKGRVFLEQADPIAALECFERALPVMRDENCAVDFASAHFLIGSVEQAWKSIEKFARESVNGRLLAIAGDCHFHWKRYPVAIHFYQRARHFGWVNQQTLKRLGYSLRRVGNIREAERYFRQILEYDSADIAATLGLGACLEGRGLYERALIIYQSGQAWDLGDGRILRQAGICAVRTHQYPYGELYLAESIKRGGATIEALAYLGYSYEKQKKWSQAEKIYRQLVDQYAGHVAGYRALAWLYGVGLSESLDAAEGLAMAKKALEILPDSSSWELLSACEARAGNYAKAHNIQEQLSHQTEDQSTRLRRRNAMRILRQKRPLDEEHVYPNDLKVWFLGRAKAPIAEKSEVA
jgi:tetratricopeptide (TPR) repeat protein